jgi:hypothetical protein
MEKKFTTILKRKFMSKVPTVMSGQALPAVTSPQEITDLKYILGYLKKKRQVFLLPSVGFSSVWFGLCYL